MNARRFAVVAATAAVLATGVVFAAPYVVRNQQATFPHDKHVNLFPLCTTCHVGMVEAGEPVWPAPPTCASCHDGVVEPRVTWTPRTGPRPSNLRFTHEAHAHAVVASNPADSTLVENCAACHNEAGAPRMVVSHAVVTQCLECHGLQEPHVEVPAAACATCHVRLTDAPGLTRADIADFPRPSGHDAAHFLLGGHGVEATVITEVGGRTVAASCATCHARNLCLACHVNAPESPVIQALALDSRVPAYVAMQPVPPGHDSPAFMRSHGKEAQMATATCATCHTQASCTTCHVDAAPRAIASLPVADPLRAPGAQLERTPPPSHTWEFRDRHGPEASARPATCETCHTRSSCLECHRPENATGGGFHPQNFLTRHPSAAYSREANCSDCHNPAQFCQACHQQAGLVGRTRLGSGGYHDAFRGFSLGHGQAARQSLESCVACHTERDCAACHSAVGGGFRFSPHGPGFNAARARARNPAVCIACHGTNIPAGD
jgi:hypothetical protein